MKITKLLSFAAALICFARTGISSAEGIAASIQSDEIHGVNGSVFCINRPDESALTVVNASDFGLSADAADNTQAMIQKGAVP